MVRSKDVLKIQQLLLPSVQKKFRMGWYRLQTETNPTQ
jgi:hypothetical protein